MQPQGVDNDDSSRPCVTLTFDLLTLAPFISFKETITIQQSDNRTGQQGIWHALTVTHCNQTVIKQYKLHTTYYTKDKLINNAH